MPLRVNPSGRWGPPLAGESAERYVARNKLIPDFPNTDARLAYLSSKDFSDLLTEARKVVVGRDKYAQMEREREVAAKKFAAEAKRVEELSKSGKTAQAWVKAIRKEKQDQVAGDLLNIVQKTSDAFGYVAPFLPGGNALTTATSLIPTAFQLAMGEVPDPAGAQARIFKATTGRDLPEESPLAPVVERPPPQLEPIVERAQPQLMYNEQRNFFRPTYQYEYQYEPYKYEYEPYQYDYYRERRPPYQYRYSPYY